MHHKLVSEIIKIVIKLIFVSLHGILILNLLMIINFEDDPNVCLSGGSQRRRIVRKMIPITGLWLRRLRVQAP